MPKLVLDLVRDSALSEMVSLSASDVVLHLPRTRPIGGEAETHLLRRWPEHGAEQAGAALASAVDDLGMDPARPLLRPYLNDFFSYAVGPALGLVEQVDEILASRNITELVVVAVDAPGSLPLFGFRTAELSKGSPNLLYARISALIPEVFPEIPIRQLLIRPDPFARDWVRKPIMRVLSGAFQALFVLKQCAFYLRYRDSDASEVKDRLLLHRAQSQTRFVQRLAATGEPFALALFGQLQSTDLREIRKLDVQLDSAIPRVAAAPRDIVRASNRTRRDLRALQHLALKCPMPSRIPAGRRSIAADLGALAREVALFPAALFYRNLLIQFVSRIAPGRVVNFELVGRAAAFEAEAARTAGAHIHTVQVASIANRVHPVFPLSDVFHADSPAAERYLKGIGSVSDGVVVFSGYPGATVVSPALVGRLQRIAFYTQPYENEVTFRILDELARWAELHDAELRLRIHPRDNARVYTDLLEGYRGTVSLDADRDLQPSIAWAQVCVTRTSSAAKEALAQGKLAVLCLISRFDRGVKLDYIRPDLSPSCTIFSVEELLSRLDEPSGLLGAAQVLQREVFGASNPSGFASAVLGR